MNGSGDDSLDRQDPRSSLRTETPSFQCAWGGQYSYQYFLHLVVKFSSHTYKEKPQVVKSFLNLRQNNEHYDHC